MPKVPISALDKAVKLLSFRALSEGELRKKLREAGFPEEEVSAAADECRKRHYIDDAMLAADYTALLRSRNTGSRVIRQKLAKRQLTAEADGGLPEEDSPQEERDAARRAMDYKWRLLARESDLRKKRDKTIRFLIGRGFPPPLIFELLEEKISGTDEDINDY